MYHSPVKKCSAVSIIEKPSPLSTFRIPTSEIRLSHCAFRNPTTEFRFPDSAFRLPTSLAQTYPAKIF